MATEKELLKILAKPIKDTDIYDVKTIWVKAVTRLDGLSVDYKKHWIPFEHYHRPCVVWVKDYKIVWCLPCRSTHSAMQIVSDIACLLMSNDDDNVLEIKPFQRRGGFELRYKVKENLK